MAEKKKPKYTADNPMPKPGERVDKHGNLIPAEWFGCESDGLGDGKFEAVPEKQIDKEEAAIDALLDGDDELFDKLDY